MNPEELSRELREEESPSLSRRRRIVGLSLIGAACMGVIGLYQTGLIRHLPEPPLPGLDADKVDGSAEAYEKLQTPDALLGLVSFSTTAALAAAGGKERNEERPLLALATAGKVLLDAAQAAKLSYDQWARHKAFCSWCLTAAMATFASLPPALAEARQALDVVLREPDRTEKAEATGGSVSRETQATSAGAEGGRIWSETRSAEE